MDHDANGPEPAVAPALPIRPSTADADKAEQLLRQAMVFQRRQDIETYRKLLDEAIAVAPGSASVILAQAEELVQRKRTKEALVVLKTGLQLYPGHVQMETLYGEAVLSSSGYAGSMLSSDFEVMAQGKTATFLAAIVPGLGHVVLGLLPLGIMYFSIVVLAVVWALSIPNGIPSLMALMGLNRSASTDVNPMVFIAVLTALVTWVVNVVDANARTKRVVAKAVSRPAPPVDKPFEL